MSIKKWTEKTVIVSSTNVTEYTCVNPDTNAVQIINRVALGGGSVYADNQNGVSTTRYLMKTEQGKMGNIVRPAPINRIFLTTDAPNDLGVTIIEITTDDMSFVFNSSQVVDIQGVVTVAEPVTVDGTVNIGNTISVDGSMVNIGTLPSVEISNDAGNPIPVTGNVGIAGTVPVSIAATVPVSIGATVPVSIAATLPVSIAAAVTTHGERGVYTNAATQTITAASTSQTVFPANANRKALIITNTDATAGTILWVGFTTTSNSIVSRIPLKQYETLRFDGADFVSTELITIYSTTIGATFTAKEA